MRRNKLWAGLDVGVETTSVCILDQAGEILLESACASDLKEIRHELAMFRRTRFAGVALEAGCGTHLARGLRSRGYPVELFETRKLSKFLRARRNKTDAGDARGIAEAGRVDTSAVSRVYLKDFDSHCLQSRLTIRRLIIRQRVSTMNFVGRLVEQFGGRVSPARARGQLRRNVELEWRKILGRMQHPLTMQLHWLLDHYEWLEKRLREIDRELRQEVSNIEVCQRFMEIPGVGPICALNFYAAIGDPRRFARTSDVGAYLGLAPVLYQSGLTSRMGRISKMGNRAARALLVQAAICFMQSGELDSELRHWALKLEERRGKMRSRIALARKLAIVMTAMWKDGTRYSPKHDFSSPMQKKTDPHKSAACNSTRTRGMKDDQLPASPLLNWPQQNYRT